MSQLENIKNTKKELINEFRSIDIRKNKSIKLCP